MTAQAAKPTSSRSVTVSRPGLKALKTSPELGRKNGKNNNANNSTNRNTGINSSNHNNHNHYHNS